MLLIVLIHMHIHILGCIYAETVTFKNTPWSQHFCGSYFKATVSLPHFWICYGLSCEYMDYSKVHKCGGVRIRPHMLDLSTYIDLCIRSAANGPHPRLLTCKVSRPLHENSVRFMLSNVQLSTVAFCILHFIQILVLFDMPLYNILQ